MEKAVEALRARGEAFSMSFTTLAGRPIEAQGRAIAGRAVLRLKDASGVKRELLELAGRHEALLGEVASLRTLIEKLPSPVWTRDAAGRLTFVNAAYARAVEARERRRRRRARIWNCSTAPRAKHRADARRAGGAYAGRLPAVVAGARRSFDVLDFRTETGSAGLGIDATEAETMRSALARMVDAHRRTLDQLSTGVAMFDAEHRLTFYNAAYRALWNLDAAFLDQGPTDFGGARRVARRAQAAGGAGLPAMEGAAARPPIAPSRRREHTWHLPDGRTLARRHHAQSGRRRHLSVQRRDRAARSGAALRGTDPRPGRNARQSRRRRRRVRQRRPAAAANSAFARMWRLSPADARRAAAHRDDHGAVPAAARRCIRPGRRCATS